MSISRRATAGPLPSASPTIPGPGRFIPFSDLLNFQRSPLSALVNITQTYGDLVQYPVGFWTIYLLNHPDYVKHVLLDNNRNYTKETFQYGMLRTVTGEGLLTSDGSFWLRQRRLAQPAFHREHLATLGDGMTAATAAMLERWRPTVGSRQPLDIDAEMMRLTLEIVGQALFRVDLSGEAETLAKAVLTALDHVIFRARTPYAMPPSIPTPRNRRFQAAMETLDRTVHQLIASHRTRDQQPDDLLGLLLHMRDEETGEGMTDAQVRDEVITLLIAGHETVASAMTWAWYFLSTHPTVARHLTDEVRGVLGGRPPTVADLPALRYTRMVIEETLRLYPPAWVMTRRAIGEDSIGGYRIPPGALIFISPYVTHRHPDFWENPEGFDPTRFESTAVASRPRFAYFPFGGGPRLCIGNNFALMEAQLILATVAQHYRLDLAPGHPIEAEPSVTLRPRHGLPMTLHPHQ